MYKALYLSPMIPSRNMKATIAFFRDLFGFQVLMDQVTYGIVQKDNLTLHILPAAEDIGQMEFYLEVDDVDVVWDYIKDKVDGLNFREPFNREYGMREIHIYVPHTNTLMFIGQTIR